MTRWLTAAVLLVSLAPFGAGAPGPMKTTAFLLAGAGLVLLRVSHPWARAFGVLATVSCITAGAPAWALWGLLAVLAWLLLFDEAARRLTAETWPSLRVAITAAALLQVAWLGVQALGLDPFFIAAPPQSGPTPPLPATAGWFGNRMDLALFLGIALPAVVAVHPLLGALTAGAMLWWLPMTVGVMAIAVTAAWWWGWPRVTPWARAAIVAVVAVLALGYLARYDSQGLGLRPSGWRDSLGLIAARPVTGWGPNALNHVVFLYAEAINNYWNHLFNEWLQGALEMGLGAPVIAAGFVGSLARRLRGSVAEADECIPAFVILLAASTFSIPLRVAPVALLAALYVGRLWAVAQAVPAPRVIWERHLRVVAAGLTLALILAPNPAAAQPRINLHDLEVMVNPTSTLARAASSVRSYLGLINDSSVILYCALGGADAAVGQGIKLAATGTTGDRHFFETKVPQGPIKCISSSGINRILILEGR